MSSNVIKVHKALRLTSKYANKGKKQFIFQILDDVKCMKNQMSNFIYNHLHELVECLRDGKKKSQFISNYRQWKHTFLPAHTIQTLFCDVMTCYLNHIKQLINNVKKKIHIQSKLNISKRSQRISIEFRKSPLCKLVAYLLVASNLQEYTSLSQIEEKLTNEELQEFWQNLSFKKKMLVINIVNSKIQRILRRIKLIRFNSGSFRLTTSGYSYEIVKDEDNILFKYFLKLAFKSQSIYLPLLLEDNPKNKRSKKYFQRILSGDLKKQIFLIDRRNSTNSKKLFFAVIKEEDLTFQDFGKFVGCDVNLTSEKFLTFSNGFSVEFDEKFLKEYLSFLREIDKKGYQNLTKDEKRKLKKYTKRIEWYIEFIIANAINKLKQLGYTDIVLEDLDPFNDGKFYVNLFGYKLKLNRFVRFLRLTGLKEKFIRIAHNRGIRVHLTHPAYSSQMCPCCGYISKTNRKSQSEFVCEKCGFRYDADRIASVNLLLRIKHKDVCESLHTQTKDTKEFRAKQMSTRSILSVLEKYFDFVTLSKLLVQLVDVLPTEFLARYFQHKRMILSGFHHPVPR